MSFDIDSSPALSSERANRRLASGLLLSILFHALLLALRFGVPGLGLPAPVTPAPPITVVLAPPAQSPPDLVVEPPPLPPSPAPKTGMQMVDRVPPPVSAAPVLAQARPRQPRRISRPLPPREPVASPTRVIAQDQNRNEAFVVPLPQPEESAQKTVDPKQAQEGSDDGAAEKAALLAEEKQQELADKLAAEAQAEREEQARLLAEKRTQEENRKVAEALQLQQQRRAEQELVERKQLEERAANLARVQAAQDQVIREQAEQMAKQQADELALRHKAEELAQRQKAEALALKMADELAARQRAEEHARQKAAELARQQAEQIARQQAEQIARQQAEQIARQQAEQIARQQAEQIARQQAEQARQQAEQARQQAEQAARQQAEQAAREQAANQAAQRERARTASANAGDPGAGTGGAGVTLPKNMFGSAAGDRARELARGIDLLSGDPPRPRPGNERSNRRAVVGAGERDVPLRMYVDSFRQKIERNGGIALSPQSGDRVRIDPLVSVALRSDGSVEDVTIVRSSGHAEIDDAVRRIVRVNARFSSFPPNIADKYDIIEIRRIWSFAETLKLMEELR